MKRGLLESNRKSVLIATAPMRASRHQDMYDIRDRKYEQRASSVHTWRGPELRNSPGRLRCQKLEGLIALTEWPFNLQSQITIFMRLVRKTLRLVTPRLADMKREKGGKTQKEGQWIGQTFFPGSRISGRPLRVTKPGGRCRISSLERSMW
ncbi:hypothetical protein KQX54_005214 [Cotesia glomerata]|uniref:Uncharacterized protein n=1 Tax=Cotesia glomerata TaxID=32391 RepID=A0AAV7HYY8_COTGL|nr:hypothetical protein KQX54_005214 [Cotesia glomerata]